MGKGSLTPRGWKLKRKKHDRARWKRIRKNKGEKGPVFTPSQQKKGRTSAYENGWFCDKCGHDNPSYKRHCGDCYELAPALPSQYRRLGGI